jgi:hypothetical protein
LRSETSDARSRLILDPGRERSIPGRRPHAFPAFPCLSPAWTLPAPVLRGGANRHALALGGLSAGSGEGR